MMNHAMGYFGHREKNSDDKKTLWASFKVLDDYLDGKHFLVGNSLTIADIVVAATLSVVYQTEFDQATHDKYPELGAWLERTVNLPSFVRRFGYLKKPFADAAPVAAAAPAKKDDDDLDLFGDDDEDDDEAAK